jgi:hypothetical protein
MASGALTLVQVNDVHGYLEPHPELVWHGAEARFPMLGGYARIAGYVEALRRERPVVLLDNGDTFHGTYPVVHSKGEALLPILNAIRFDAIRAQCNEQLGRLPEAISEMQALRETGAGLAEVLGLADMYVRRGDLAQAAQTISGVADDPDVTPELALRFAQVLGSDDPALEPV